MNCEQALELIGAAVDREIDDDRTALEAHLASCAECREAEAALRKQDADLLRAFQADRGRAGQLAELVIAELSVSPTTGEPADRRTHWLWLLLATAGGFLLAVLVFQPWERAAPPVVVDGGGQQPPNNNEARVTNVARLVESTGDVKMGKRSARPGPAAYLSCPSNKPVRTEADVRCELVTDAGCVIRMDGKTELTFGAADSVKLQSGQIWCRLPKDAALEIVPGTSLEHPRSSDPPPSPWSCTTPAPEAAFLSQVQPDGSIRIIAAEGEVAVKTSRETLVLKQGQAAVLTGDRVETKDIGYGVPLDLWIMPLLVKKGHDNQELNQRVDQLLAGIGQTKLSTLYEQEIRNLGEYGVLPLLRYVQSPMSHQEQERRLRAMRIIADLAPGWAIGDLIGLLEDGDADVRQLAARALERLTGHDQGCPADMWQAPSELTAQSHERWNHWWQQNRHRFPQPAKAGERSK